MASLFAVLAVLALFAQGSLAIICNECRTAGQTPGTVDYCADPNADSLVACPRTENVCYSTLALISNRIVISRGCGRPLSLPASANLAVNTCRAFGDLSATAIFCICDGQSCNNQTAASPDVQQGLQNVAAVQPSSAQNTNNNIDDRQSRTLVPGQVGTSTTFITAPAQNSRTVQVLVPANNNNNNNNNPQRVFIVQQGNQQAATTTTTTEAATTETPSTEAPAVVNNNNAQPQQIQVLVPNANTRPVYIVRPNPNGGQDTVQVILPSTSTTQSSVANNEGTTTNTVVVVNANDNNANNNNNGQTVSAIRNPVIISQLVPGAATSTSAPVANDNEPATTNNNGTAVIVIQGNPATAATESNMADMVRAHGSATSETTMSPTNGSAPSTTVIAIIENGTVVTPHNGAESQFAFGSSAIIMALVLAIVPTALFV